MLMGVEGKGNVKASVSKSWGGQNKRNMTEKYK